MHSQCNITGRVLDLDWEDMGSIYSLAMKFTG